MAIEKALLDQIDHLDAHERQELIRYLLAKEEDADYYRMVEQTIGNEWDNELDAVYDAY